MNPADLRVAVTSNSRPLPADKVTDLSPVLRTVIANQPEYSSWSPSTLCLYYMESVDLGSLTVTERTLEKLPLIGVWSIAATEVRGGGRRDAVLSLFTNTGRIERAGQVNGLDIRTIRSTVRVMENEENRTAPPVGIRYDLKVGKTLLTWDGRRVTDSTRATGSQSVQWRADSRRRGEMVARLRLAPQWTKAMVGSLRVEGNDALADAIKASPVRFVGPAMLGGGGELAFGR